MDGEMEGGRNRHEIKNERQREMKDGEICESDAKVNETVENSRKKNREENKRKENIRRNEGNILK